MRAEVIAIGDELTSGQRLDTNSQWLSQKLADLGVEVMFHTTVGDDLAANVDVFQSAIARSDILVATGGLGPTADDLTRTALAQALGVELVLDEGSLESIRGMFAARGRKMPEKNACQAMFPAGAIPIANPHGTAPGIQFVAPRPAGGVGHVFALPGVPAEMHEMWQAAVAPAIAALQPERRVIRHRAIKVFGPGESQLEAMLPDLIRRGREPRVGITASGATLTLRITATGADDASTFAAIEPTAQEIYTHAGGYIFGEGDDELEHVVLRLLRERGQTLAVNEDFTAGLVTIWLTTADPTGEVFCGGFVSRRSGSDIAVRARECRDRTGTTFGLAIGPATGAEEIGVALADGDSVHCEIFKLGGHPAVVVPRIAKSSLNMLRLHLLEL